MTKRLTAEEVVRLFDDARNAELDRENPNIGRAATATMCRDVVRDNLIPQWQDEPDGDGGLVWVRFADEEKNSHRWGLPYVAWKEDGEWWIEDWNEFTMRLDGRKVCPITPRPNE